MFYKIGKVTSFGKNYIIFESNYTGSIVYVSKPSNFEKEKIIKLYVYLHKSEFLEVLYGFKVFNERIIFSDLLSVSGVGPKTAISLLGIGYKNLVQAITSENVERIRAIPYIGHRVASMIVFELKAKYLKIFQPASSKKHFPEEIQNTLKTLGFKKEQIEYAISKLTPNNSIETLIEEAIRTIASAKKIKTINV